MNTSTLKVMVIDSDPRMLEAYPYYFHTYRDYELCGLYSSALEALKDFGRTQPDIVISEMRLPEQSGISTLQAIRKMDSNAQVIMVSEENEFEKIKEAFKYGAVGYLTKPISKDRLLNALDAIKYEGAAISSDIARKVIDMFRRKSYERFSERENEIVEYLCQGATYKMIAEKLFVSPSTVNFHIQNIYLKLDVNSKAEALNKLQELDLAS